MLTKQSPHLLLEVPTAQALRVTAPHCPPTPQAVSITPPLWEVPTPQPLWEMPTATLFPRPIRPHRQKLTRGPNSLAKPSADLTARKAGAKSPQKPHSQGKKSYKERVEITPSFIPNQAPTPKTKVLLDQSGPRGTRQGVVSPATKPTGDRPQRLSSMKWWRPLSFSGTLEGLGQTEEILTS